MAKVITLDGLKGTKPVSVSRKCTFTPMYSPTLDREVQVCKEDVQRLQETSGGMSVQKRGRGRPRGSTVARGARKPTVKSCSKTKVVETKSGRQICKCSDSGNTQILPNSRCGLERKARR
jgi:hypothetical protein